MKITKFGHCCLLIEEKEIRILTDPGSWNDTPDAKNIDVILISHEHADHIHIESLKTILKSNEKAVIYTHEGVKKLLDKENISCVLIGDGEEINIKGVSIISFGTDHACIHHDISIVQNTGFYIANKFFYPGDSFHNPNKDIEILALPVVAPWMKIEEAIEYAKAIKPKIVFPVHDGMLREDRRLFTRMIPKNLLEKDGMQFVDLKEGVMTEF
ncbi:MAG: MBL fold metallo-hydrolase [Candidatus Nomurabacteria bacterium]